MGLGKACLLQFVCDKENDKVKIELEVQDIQTIAEKVLETLKPYLLHKEDKTGGCNLRTITQDVSLTIYTVTIRLHAFPGPLTTTIYRDTGDSYSKHEEA